MPSSPASSSLPVGKLPLFLQERLLALLPTGDPRVIQGPGLGLDCAVVEAGPKLLVYKSDPITFATDEIGWYAVQVNANDIATTGAEPRWFLTTLLLPEGASTPEMVERIAGQVAQACREIGVTVIGGHTEVTYGLERPILLGTLIGEVAREELVLPSHAQPGDRLLLTKGVPVEATAILARELPDRLQGILAPAELEEAQGYLHHPGISVLRDARIALGAGQVHAMHDPTEGGLLGALWELSEASRRSLRVDLAAAPVPELAGRICKALGIDPLAAIASGALLLAVSPSSAGAIARALLNEGIPCAEIGEVGEGENQGVWNLAGDTLQPRPKRDEVAKLFERGLE